MLVTVKPGKADVEGVWVEYQEGVRFKVARAGNSAFLKASDKLEAPHRKQIARGTLSTEKQIEIQCQAMAEGLLKDWEGVEDKNGPLPFSVEVAANVLRYNPDVREFVTEAAIKQDNFRDEEIKQTAKKL